MLTKSDITKLKEIFATKAELKELKSDLVKLKDMIHEVIFELKDMREEFIAITYRNRDHSDKIESHEVRITNLEKKFSS
ncbi:MAG: hypothetical protein BroJett025_01150 [Patescibacteria group bacterium]|nr:MAG: hypothetical protein BroJett025_01150 [Patescibacteria group bacterium]